MYSLMSKKVKRLAWLTVAVAVAGLTGWTLTVAEGWLGISLTAYVGWFMAGVVTGVGGVTWLVRRWMAMNGYVVGRPLPIALADADD